MICPNCRQENPDDAKICSRCGHSLQNDVPPVFRPPVDEEENTYETVTNQEPSQPHAKSNKGVIIALSVILVVVIGILIGFGVRSINESAKKDAQIEDLQKQNEEANNDLQEEKEARQQAEEAARGQEDARDQAEREARQQAQEDTDLPFSSGTYVANYNMVIRDGADYDANRTGSLKKDQSVTIVDVVEGENDSYWGKTDSGQYICIQDPSYTYLRKN